MKTFPLQVLKINQAVFEGDVVSVSVPGRAGDLTVLAQHETMLSSLRAGEISIKPKEGAEVCVEIEHGFIEATTDNVTILI